MSWDTRMVRVTVRVSRHDDSEYNHEAVCGDVARRVSEAAERVCQEMTDPENGLEVELS